MSPSPRGGTGRPGAAVGQNFDQTSDQVITLPRHGMGRRGRFSPLRIPGRPGAAPSTRCHARLRAPAPPWGRRCRVHADRDRRLQALPHHRLDGHCQRAARRAPHRRLALDTASTAGPPRARPCYRTSALLSGHRTRSTGRMATAPLMNAEPGDQVQRCRCCCCRSPGWPWRSPGDELTGPPALNTSQHACGRWPMTRLNLRSHPPPKDGGRDAIGEYLIALRYRVMAPA